MKNILLVLLCLITFGCLDKNELPAGEYALLDSPENAEITIMLKDGNFAGVAAINHYFGIYTLKNDKITLSVSGLTMMAGPENLMAIESEYLQNIGKIDSWQYKDNLLILKSADGLNLVFKKL